MYFGVETFTDEGFGNVPSSIDESIPNPGRILLADADAKLLFVFESNLGNITGDGLGMPYPMMSFPLMTLPLIDTQQSSRQYFADDEFITIPGDVPSNTNMRPRLIQAMNFKASIPLPTDLNAKGNISQGLIIIANNDGELDNLLIASWIGRIFTIKVGGSFNVGKFNETSLLYSEMPIILKGIIQDISWNEDEIRLTVRSRMSELDKSIQNTLYLGTGSLEGDSNLQDQPKPLAYGKIINIAPPLVDTVNLIYQLHDGAMQAVDEVRDNGVLLLFDADYADITGATATLDAGEYATSLATGFIKLGGIPDGQVTVDLQGDKTPSYTSKASEILRRIATTKSTFVDPDEIDSISFNDVSGDEISVSGIWLGHEKTSSFTEVFNLLMLSDDGWWTLRRDGKLAVGLHIDPVKTISIRTLEDKDILNKLERRKTPEPVWRYRIGYEKKNTVQDESSFAGSVSQADKFLWSHEHKFISARDIVIESSFLKAQDLEVLTLINTSADATIQSSTRLIRDKVRRDLYKVVGLRNNFQEKLGTVIKLQISQFDLDSGKNFLLVGITENSNTRSVELELYG